MPEAVEAQIPAEVREQFHRDDQGRILLFSSPPRPPPAPKGLAPDFLPPEHSVRYLAQMKKYRGVREAQRAERADHQKQQEQQQQLTETRGRAEQEAHTAKELSRLRGYGSDAAVPGVATGGKTQEQIVDELVEASAAYLNSLLKGVRRAHEAEMMDLEGWDAVKRSWEEERSQRRAAGENI
jgi:hypothetical protein